MSLVAELNGLLSKTRGALEATQIMAEEIHRLDPDMDSGLEDIIDNERWSSSGLYHRISQLDGTPNIETSDFAAEIGDKDDINARINFLCSYQQMVVHDIRRIMGQGDIDETTWQLLTEMRDIHHANARWCERVLAKR